MFHDGDLQSGIALAMQSQKAVLCFVADDGETSAEWEAALFEESIEAGIRQQAIAIKMEAGSQEAAFLAPFAPIDSAPAIVVIRNAALQVNLQARKDSLEDVERTMKTTFKVTAASEESSGQTASVPVQSSPKEPSNEPSSASVGYLDLPSSAGQPRLPNNAYEALREYTEDLKTQGKTPEQIFEGQLTVLSKLPIFKDEVRRLRSLNPGSKPELSPTARERLLLRLPAAAIKAQMKAQPSGANPATSTPSASTSSSTLPTYESVYSQQTNESASATNTTPTTSSRAQQSPPPPSTPATATAPPPSYDSLSESQRNQQAEYRRLQKEREQKARDERERIKAQIKADREERRRREAVQKQNDAAAVNENGSISTSTTRRAPSDSKPVSNNRVRVQVRTFDGTPLNTTFAPTATITDNIRPWLDSQPDPNVDAPSSLTRNIPYDFKLILTPLPNRKIEAAEESLALSELGIKGSCTFVIAPVRGYVDSYSSGGSGPVGAVASGAVGVAGTLVNGGYNLVSGTVGAVGSAMAGIGRGLFGYNAPTAPPIPSTAQRGDQSASQEQSQQAQQRNNVRVRTLADQRAEQGRGNQFYNGNTLNFEPNRDRDDDRKQD